MLLLPLGIIVVPLDKALPDNEIESSVIRSEVEAVIFDKKYLDVMKKLKNEKEGIGYNAADGKFEDMIKAGIVDPTMVTRSALQNAASVSALLLTTEAVVADKPDPNANNQAPAAPQGGMGGMM